MRETRKARDIAAEEARKALAFVDERMGRQYVLNIAGKPADGSLEFPNEREAFKAARVFAENLHTFVEVMCITPQGSFLIAIVNGFDGTSSISRV